MNKLKSLVALVLALMMAFSVISFAFAEGEGGGTPAAATPASPFDATSTVNVTISGIVAGDTVSFYKLGTPSVDAANEMSITWTNNAIGTMLDGKTTEAWNYSPSAPIQAGLAKLIADGDITLTTATYTTAAAEGTSITQAVAPGYYLAIVRQGTGSGATGSKIIYQNMLINAVPQPNSSTGAWESHTAITATAKHTDETLTKTQSNGSNYTAETLDGYKFGDYIPFKINTNIPSYPQNSKVAVFEITDNPTGLRIVDDATHPLVLKVADTNVTSQKTDTVNTNTDDTFKITVSGGNLKIEFDKDYILAHPNQRVEVTYYAELLGNDNDVEVDETNNTAKIKYNNNPDEETYQEPETEIKQKTYNFTFLKYSTADDATALASRPGLAGAKFTLWTAATAGATGDTQIALKKDGDVYRPIKDGETADTYIEVDADGKATIVGLAKGTYYLQEDVAPANYKKSDTRIAATANETSSAVGVDYGVPNVPGTTLPETGGIGTTIFYIAGLVLVLGAAAVIIARRKAEQ